MKPLILLGVLIISPAIHGLSCISYDQILVVPLPNLNRESFMKRIDELSSNQDEAVCSVWLVISYAENLINIKFSKLLKENKLPVDQVTFVTVVAPNQNRDIWLHHVIQYACSKSDECEKYFLFGHIEWLLGASYPDLTTNIASLIVNQNSSPGKCRDFRDDRCKMIMKIISCDP